MNKVKRPDLKDPYCYQEGSTLKILIPIDLRPQQKEFLSQATRYNVLLAHRRWGKSVCLVLKMVLSFLTIQRKNPKFWYVLPTKKQAVETVGAYFYDMLSKIPNIKIERDSESFIATINLGDGYGTRTLELVGARAGDTKRGNYLDGVVVDEMGVMERGFWEGVISPMLLDRQGWAVLTGTPSIGYWKEFYHGAKESEQFTVFDFGDARTTGVYTTQELKIAEELAKDKAAFRMEWYSEWITAEIGTYYSEALFRLKDLGYMSHMFQYNDKLPLLTAWDLGTNDYTVVWFFQYDLYKNEMIFIDYYEKRGAINDEEHVEAIKQRGYKVDLAVLPWDSASRSRNAKLSSYDIISQHFPCTLVKKTASVKEDIQIVQNFLQNCRFNSANCAKGIDELFTYRSAVNKKTDQISASPIHSDAADSFRYAVMGLFQDKIKYTNKAIEYRNMFTNPHTKNYTFNDLI